MFPTNPSLLFSWMSFLLFSLTPLHFTSAHFTSRLFTVHHSFSLFVTPLHFNSFYFHSRPFISPDQFTSTHSSSYQISSSHFTSPHHTSPHHTTPYLTTSPFVTPYYISPCPTTPSAPTYVSLQESSWRSGSNISSDSPGASMGDVDAMYRGAKAFMAHRKNNNGAANTVCALLLLFITCYVSFAWSVRRASH